MNVEPHPTRDPNATQPDEVERLADELAEYVDRGIGGRRGLSSSEVREAAARVRSASAVLAAERRRRPAGDASLAALERSVVRARALFSIRTGRRLSVVGFLRDEYWQLLAARRRPLALAAVLLVVPSLLGFAWATRQPEVVENLVPEGFLWVRDAPDTDIGAGAGGLAAFSFFVMRNNIQVTLLTFVLGVTWGLGTAWVLAQNGLILGAVAGLAVDAGNGRVLVEAIVAHGVLELSCIVVGGAAGLAVGRAMLRPGTMTRTAALASEAGSAVRLAVGTAAWLVLAGLLEGFASRTGLDAVPATIVGLVVGGVFWGLAVVRGRATATEGTRV